MTRARLRVGVIFGGRSGEHEVSLASARSVMAAMDPERYEIIPIGITRSGQWLTAGDPLARLTAGPREGIFDPSENAAGGPADPIESSRELVPGASAAGLPQMDVIFPVLHGPYGEDGTIQGLLELADLPYVGCGVLASALAMDKIASKGAYMAAGLPVVPYVALSRNAWETGPAEALDHITATLSKILGKGPWPLFVKPANLGSSIGVSKARDRAELAAALDEAARYDRRLLIEAAVPAAREIECSVLGNDEPIASVPGEVMPSNEFYDYSAKYIDGRSELLIPAPLPPETTARVQEMAVRAFRAIDGAGLARVDFLMDGESGELYLNEINTLPGFTSISMYPKLWEASGVPYPELIHRLIDLAMERHADKTRSRTRFDAPAGGDL
jgi:D-alanine-D-alanine ligase